MSEAKKTGHFRLTSQEHYSEAFCTSAFLALSGGFQDAYTYNCRDGVFSNAQTGNIVLMSQHLMQGEWGRCLHYFVPVVAFALGVLISEQIQHRYKYAGTDVPEGRRLFLCKHDVHRKPARRHGGAVRLFKRT